MGRSSRRRRRRRGNERARCKHKKKQSEKKTKEKKPSTMAVGRRRRRAPTLRPAPSRSFSFFFPFFRFRFTKKTEETTRGARRRGPFIFPVAAYRVITEFFLSAAQFYLVLLASSLLLIVLPDLTNFYGISINIDSIIFPIPTWFEEFTPRPLLPVFWLVFFRFKKKEK